jgi:class 3 adenylate cyclase
MYGGVRSDFIHDFSIARDFLAEDRVDLRPAGFRTILFTDLEGSTLLTQWLGDESPQELLEQHDAIVRAALAAHDGVEVKHTGGRIMARFVSAVAGVDASLEMRDGLADRGICAHRPRRR